MVMAKLLLSIVILNMTHPLILIAHSRDPKFEQLSTENGLSNVAVYSMLQDSTGFLWIGTKDGLNRYDGYTFKKFYSDTNDPETLSSNTIKAICESKGNKAQLSR